MPRITIGDTGKNDFAAEVSWTKDLPEVKLSIRAFPKTEKDVSGFAFAWGDNLNPDGEGAEIFDAVYSDSLNRSAVNELIRILRRARDAAYGADA